MSLGVLAGERGRGGLGYGGGGRELLVGERVFRSITLELAPLRELPQDAIEVQVERMIAAGQEDGPFLIDRLGVAIQRVLCVTEAE